MGIISIRGATTVSENNVESIQEATKELLETIIRKNAITPETTIQILFSVTKDLNAGYPAVVARQIGFIQTSLMCFQEMEVIGSLKKCIRLAMLVEKEGASQSQAKHCYLRDAKKLRPDLVE